MVTQVSRAVSKFVQLIHKHYSNIESAYVFGSFAKGTSSADSDVDIAIIFKNLDDSERFDLQVDLMLLAAQVDSRIEPHPFSQIDFDAGNPFIAEIKKTGTQMID